MAVGCGGKSFFLSWKVQFEVAAGCVSISASGISNFCLKEIQLRHQNFVRILPAMIIFAIIATSTAWAGEPSALTIERIFADPSLSGPSPQSLKLAPDGSRVTFLQGKTTDKDQLDLWEYNIADGQSRILVDSQILLPGEEILSDEEKARRQRQRLGAFKGIVEYFWSGDGNALLFPLAGDIYLYDLSLPAGKATTRLTETEEFETDIRFSPRGHYVSFIRQQNIFIIDRSTGTETQLTFDGGGTIANGMAEFVAQEEMHRFTGYWWSPDEKHIAFEQFDESPVPVVQRYEINAHGLTVTNQRYPAAGDPNVLVRLAVTDLKGTTVWMDLGAEKDIYLARVHWLDDNSLIIQRQPRSQQTVDLLWALIKTGHSTQFMQETSNTWVELNDDLTVLETPLSSFIWKSARDGYPHLYLCNTSGETLVQITKGKWCVNNVLGVDEKAGVVYFTATQKSVTEDHLYAARLDGSDAEHPRRITARDGFHNIELSEENSIYTDKFSNTDTPPQVSVHTIDGTLITWIEENALIESHPYSPFSTNHAKVEFGTIKAADGQDLHYRLTKPIPFDPGQQYPVFIQCYGGPRGPQVRNFWHGTWNLYAEYMVQHGYVVFALDNRGTGFRGTEFDDPIYGQLGNIEVEDQVTGVKFLRSLPFVDSKKIGIFGWSYGGYMALMTMMKAPDYFQAGVAVAPVTDFRLYDSHYTERYLGHPETNSQGYDATAVFPYIDTLQGKLLVIHGMADDNVLFTNSTRLFKELQDKTIPFEMMTYPGSKHSINGKATRTHVFETVTEFMDRQLKP